MSRRSPRIRARFAATVNIAGLPHTLVCHTRDISEDGCFLDTREILQLGVPLTLSLMDVERGDVVQVQGTVTRCLRGDERGHGRGIGVKLDNPPPEWSTVVDRYVSQRGSDSGPPPIRIAVLVVGDEGQRRGALALYVTSGWDVRFATDQATAEEALVGGDIDAVIAELDPGDPRTRALLDAARRLAPRARRIIRGGGGGGEPLAGHDDGLVHRVLGREAGIEALVEALADEGTGLHSSGVRPLAPAAAAQLLRSVIERCDRSGAEAVVVFDLDSTLLDNRPRQALIMREYGVEHGLAPLVACRSEHWQGWDARVAMRNAGLDEAAIEQHNGPFRQYWHSRFFTSQYCVVDQPLEGAVAYVNAVRRSGAQVCYVTGRHEEMRAGTLSCLGRHGFVLPDDRHIRLLMKPTLEEHDDVYKERTLTRLRELGIVVAAFDNEPTHINGYRLAFPVAISVHLATDHSLRGVPVKSDIPSISDFSAFGR